MNSILNSFDLYIFLNAKNLIDSKYKYWWPTNSDFEVFIGAILTQNTKWTNVEKSLENLRKLQLFDLEKLSTVDTDVLISAITPSGFKNQKSVRIKKICENILEEFGDFETFKQNVYRDWLLSQKGIGAETCDAILCYACHKEEMVVDSYTNRLVKTFGYEFESYDDLKAWLEYGINENFDKIDSLYDYDITLNMIYCRFHGKIVEFMKNQKKS
ncbi:3-methyladenine DNA glycosylase [Arcobacter sp. F2176]|uniref:3-methyladenine DNA glycosylase n=1 Tax=Arcobacter sp. F2176 TaxID=2044511 RepID=UPI00100C15E5|nr:3-methyladenine DNA glycosylase [Arcobacter sp. F2176]RXJ81662.1 3-methyladenine DNA glycosylase [Arcobacter sp. F2176]